MSNETRAVLIFDDAFTPKHVSFTECGSKIELFIDGDSIRIQVTGSNGYITGMRLPQYAVTGLAQMMLGCLNGEKLPR